MIYSSGGTTVEKREGGYVVECDNPVLLQSCRETIADMAGETGEASMRFDAKSVQTLAQLLSHNRYGLDYPTVNALVASLAQQLMFLEKNGYGVIHYSLHDVIAVNESRFFLASGLLIAQMQSGDLDIVRPLKASRFMSPETLLIHEVPAALDHRAAYYSLGVLAAFVLLKVDVNYKNLDPELDPIVATPIYCGIKRGVVDDPGRRYLLYI